MTTYLSVVSGTNSTASSIMGTTNGLIMLDSGGTLNVTGTASVVTGPNNKIEIQHKRGVSPAVYFRFVKSKMSAMQLDDLKVRVSSLRYLLDGADLMGQQALIEELERQLVTLFRHQEAAAAGFSRFVPGKYIHGYISKLNQSTVEFKPLDKFPRPIPKFAQVKIKQAKDLRLFDEYHILFNNLLRDNLKTTKEKIKEKDPIVFGRIMSDPDNYIFIIDWVDEYCDITLDKIVAIMGKDTVLDIPPLKEKDIKAFKSAVMQRHEALKDTKRDNYHVKAAEQDRIDKARHKPRWWGWFQSYLKRSRR